jgi:hypothetical protein
MYLKLCQILIICHAFSAELSNSPHYSLVIIYRTSHFHNICFTNAADMTLFCGEDLNFGAFLKYFFPGVQL